jgi:hypothetical protein
VVQVEQPLRAKRGTEGPVEVVQGDLRDALLVAQKRFNRVPERDVIRRGIRYEVRDAQ